MKRKHLGSLAFTFAMAAASGLVQAGPISFGASTCTPSGISLNGLTCGTTVAGVNHSAIFSAWSATGTNKFAAATFLYYPSSGAGIHANGEPYGNAEHAIDNATGTDAVLINFSSPNFALNQISIGWGGDADVSILRYTGTAAPSLGNYTVANLNSAEGWELVGDYSEMTPSSPLSFNNTGTVKTASWWLVSAYNSAYAGNPKAGLDNKDDYFKLTGFGGEVVAAVTPPPSQVPEPGTFALFGVALIGFAAARRKMQAK